MLLLESDEAFFKRHRNRQVRIRRCHQNEMNREFHSLGLHDERNRRMIVWKVPGNIRPPYSHYADQLMKIPYLKDPNDVIEDTDNAVMPLLEQLMEEANKEYGLGGNA